jgi:serine/threonine protein kinase/Tol biopolymer transport system component
MSLEAGEKLGRYEILSQLGKGGMGEVYLANDPKLDRRVALKVLPAEVAVSRERMVRFVQEARSAAALNHPNVAHVYEIGEQDGLNFIAMEYVEGKTLREKIHYERTELRKLIKYLQQVAGGLAKAHAAGIVHRDLKPDNIMITRDGYAKILDFGLAKLIEIPTPGPDGGTISDAATVALEPHSIPGRLLGTVGYMSPEQAQGKSEIDHRSDIFSFGCMLFEAVTKQRPFQGESNVQSLYKICYEPARPIKEFDASAPADLQRIIRRCLAKDPEERYQSIHDIGLELKELRREMEGDTQFDSTIPPASMAPDTVSSQVSYAAPASPTISLPAATGDINAQHTTSSAGVIFGEIKRHKRGFVIGLVAFVVLIGAAIFVWTKFFNRPAAEPFRAMSITRLTTGGRIGDATIKGYASISPDGRYVVFKTTEPGRESLWVRQVSTGSLVKIVPDLGGKIGGTTFSRDGEFIYYSLFDNPLGTLFQVPVLGGTPRRIMAGVTSPVTFSPDGKQLAFVRPSTTESDLLVANVDGTGERRIATRKLPAFFAYGGGPAWSPDGKTIACGAGSYSDSSATIVSIPASGGAESPLTKQNWVSVSRVLWLGDGSGLIVAAVPELVSTGTQLWYVSYTGGDVRRVTNDLNAYGTSSLGLTNDSKTLVTVQADKSAQLWVVPSGESGNARQITNGKYDGDSIVWSARGPILYTAPSGEQSDVWSVNPNGTENRQLTSDAYSEGLGCVSSDGRYAVFSSNRSGNFNLWKLDLASSEQTQLTQGNEVDSQPQCTADGKWLVFKSLRQGKFGFWKLSLAGGVPEQLSDKSANWAAVSPDSKYVALRYFDDRANANKIAIIPFGGGEPTKVLDVSGSYRDVGLGWTADSQAIIFAESRNNADNIWSVPLAGGPSRQLSSFNGGLIFAFSVSPDGKQIALSRGNQIDDVILLKDSR